MSNKYLKKSKNTVMNGGMWSKCMQPVLFGRKCINRVCQNDCAFTSIQCVGIKDLSEKMKNEDLREGLYNAQYIDVVNSWLRDYNYPSNIRCVEKRQEVFGWSGKIWRPENLKNWIIDMVKLQPELRNYYIPIAIGWPGETSGHYVILGTHFKNGKLNAVIIEGQTYDCKYEQRDYYKKCNTKKYYYNDDKKNFVYRGSEKYFQNTKPLRYIQYITIIDRNQYDHTGEPIELKIIRLNDEQFYLQSVDDKYIYGNYKYDPDEDMCTTGECMECDDTTSKYIDFKRDVEKKFSLVYSHLDKLYTFEEFEEYFILSDVQEKWEHALPEHRYSTVRGFENNLYSYTEFVAYWGDNALREWESARRYDPTDIKNGFSLLQLMQKYGQKNGIICWNSNSCNIGDVQLELRYSPYSDYSNNLFSFKDFIDTFGDDADEYWHTTGLNNRG